MRVVCPHCNAAYQLDDARVPDRGANVRCSRCQKVFPVRKAAAGEAPGAVPLPGSAAPAPTASNGIPLPSPPPGAAPPPRAPHAAGPGSGTIPLPPPPATPGFPPPATSPFGEAFPAARAPSPFQAEAPASPFDVGPTTSSSSPFGAEPAALPSPFGAEPAAPRSPFDADPAGAQSPFGAEPFAPTQSPFGSDVDPLAGADLPFGTLPSIPQAPARPPSSPSDPLSFGEVDLSAEVADAPAAASAGASPFEPGLDAATAAQPDPFELSPRGAPPVPPPSGPRAAPSGEAEDLEMLFGESPPKAPSPASTQPHGYQVRRRSGKIFGPFQEAQVVEMLSKGELLGNEDVSTDGSTYSPIGAVAAFGAALRKAAAAEPAAKPAAPVVFGDRMAAAKVVEGRSRRVLPRWVKWAGLALPAVLVLAAGVAAGFTQYGFFFTRMLRRGDPAALANLLTQARTALARGDFASERAGLDHAARAVAVSPGSSEAAMIHALAVATLELGHGAPPEALAQARNATDALARGEKAEVTALAAQLAMGLCADPVSVTAAQEQALEAALAKRKPDPDVLALLARSALARGDAARAAAQAAKLAGIEKGPRAPLLLARASLLRRAPEARAALEKVLATNPEILAAHLELATLDEQAGNPAQASARLQPLVADAARGKLAPAERARALAMLGSIVSLDPARTAEADKLLSDAVAADPRTVDARVRLVLHRLRRGDPAGAVAATDPVAKGAVQRPELAAVRVRALALAGRALDAAQLADQALARTPGRSELLLGKAFALVAAGKPEEARAIYVDAVARDQGAVEARVALARFALAAGDLGKAGELLEAGPVKESRDPSALSVKGDLLMAKGDPGGAEAAYRKALQLDPTHASAEVGMARLALARGNVAAARVALASAVAHEPRNADILVEHGSLLWRSGELGAAEAAFSAAVEGSPKHALALTRLGAVLLQKGDAEGAVRRLTAASNEAPALVEARLWLGRALLARSEAPGAIVQLKKAVDLSRTGENLLALGTAYEKAGSLGDALETYRAAAAVAPSSSEPQERIALLLTQTGRCDEAIPAFQRGIEVDPKLSRLQMGLAECTARLGKHEEAVKLFQALLKRDPRAVQAYFPLARSLHEWKGMAAALPWYERAARQDPGDAMPHYYLAYAYKEHGQKAKAIQEFRLFLEKKPDAPERKDIEAEIEDLGGK